jgi:hypothetical protein
VRLRILVGSLGLVLGLALYGLAVAAAARLLLPENVLVAIGFYAVAGLAWVPPAGLLTRWMQRAPPHRPSPGA